MGRKKAITLAKELDFETEEQYFDYILDSEINGQRQQVRSLISDMRFMDILNCLRYLRSLFSYETRNTDLYNDFRQVREIIKEELEKTVYE